MKHCSLWHYQLRNTGLPFLPFWPPSISTSFPDVSKVLTQVNNCNFFATIWAGKNFAGFESHLPDFFNDICFTILTSVHPNSFPPIFNHHNDIWIHTASFCWTHKWCKYNTNIEESFTWMHFLHYIRLNLLSVSIITFHKDLFNKRKCVHTYLSTNALNVDDTVSIPIKQLADCSVQINIVF